MAKAGKNYKKLRVGLTSGGTFTLIKGISEAGMNRSGEEIDVTAFDSTTGFKQYLLGLKEFEITMSGNYEPSDADGQKLLDIAQNDGTKVFIQYLLKGDGVTTHSGIQAECVIINFSHSGSVSDKESVEITCKLAEGAVPTEVTPVTV